MTSIIGTLKLKANNTMKILNQLIPFLSGVLVLTACSSEVANANIDVAEADTVAAQNEVISKAQLELPFVGKKFFDFVRANATMESITIELNGYTTIEGQAGNSSYVIYEGMYSPMMSGYEGEGYYAVIGKNAIAKLDSEGNLQYGEGCNIDEGKPCISAFIPDDHL